jgi:hypothetical protein
LKGLLAESWNSAVLDCGATRTCAGDTWLGVYQENLPPEQSNIPMQSSKSVYRFGDGRKVPAIGHVKIPAVLGEREVTIGADIVKENIPLLFSRESMRKAEMLLNFKDNTVQVFDSSIPMNITKTGHCTIPISPATQLIQRIDDNDVKVTLSVVTNKPSRPLKALKFPSRNRIPVLLAVRNPTDKKAIAVKLHVSFAHATTQQLLRFLKSCGEPWCSDSECAPLSWASQRIKRVVRSTLAAEAVSLNNACDDSVYLGRIIMSLCATAPMKSIPIVAYCDNQSTIDSINSTTPVSDKKLRLEIAALREYQETKEIDIRKVDGKQNISDVLTKRGASSKSLLSVLTRGCFNNQ